MRHHLSTQWSAARDAHKAAYAIWDAFAEAGDDGVRMGGTQASDDAVAAEVAALDACLMLPSVTPLDVNGKIDLMRERDITISWGDVHDHYVEQIQRDLFQLQRMACSPEMKALFDAWRAARIEWFASFDDGDEVSTDKLNTVYSPALLAVMEAPCVAGGDFLVKLYVDLLDEAGGTESQDHGSMFEVNEAGLDDSGHDGAALASRLRDLKDTDIGRCLLALGQVDFAPGDWVEAMLACGAHASLSLVLEADGARQLGFGMRHIPDAVRDRHRMLLHILNFAGQSERSDAVADEIEAHWPNLVFGRTSTAQAVAA